MRATTLPLFLVCAIGCTQPNQHNPPGGGGQNPNPGDGGGGGGATPDMPAGPDLGTPAAPFDPALAQKISAALDQQLTQQPALGAVVGVHIPGRTPFYYASGYADVARTRKLVPTDRFRIGSITKTYTAALVLLLVEQGAVSLDDTLAKWYPSFTAGAKVTVRQMLNHTSGIFAYGGGETYQGDSEVLANPQKPWTMAELAARAAAHPLRFPPGTKWEYSNSNFIFLGLIAEQAGGLKYNTALHQRLLDPQQLTNTFYEPEGVPGGLQVRGTVYQAGSYTDTTNDLSPNIASCAGALVSTVDDLGRWGEILYSAKLLKPQTVQLMTTPTTLSDGTTVPYYGLATFIETAPAGNRYGHVGQFGGFVADLRYQPATGISVALVVNTETATVTDMAQAIWGAIQ